MEESDLAKLRSRCLTSIYGATKNIATYFPESDDRKEQFDKLGLLVTRYCKLDQLEDVNRKAIFSYENAEEIPKWRVMKNEYLNTVAAAAKKRSKFDKHPYMREFEKAMKHQNRLLEEFLPEEEENQEMVEDLAITETVNTYIDPVSKRPITNPVKNKICGHVYDKETACSMVNNVKNKGCPYFGCVNKQRMRAEHLVLDEDTLDKIQTRRAGDVIKDEETSDVIEDEEE